MKKAISVLVLLFISTGILLFLFKDDIKEKLPWRAQRLIQFLEKNDITDLWFCLCLPDKDIKLKRSDGLGISASLYGVKGDGKRPGIILLHGNTPLGRKLSMYLIMASRFAQMGYIVLTIDFAGYGESDDPFQLDSVEALDNNKDVMAALSYMIKLDYIDKDEVYVIGHSGGADSAFEMGIQEDGFRKIVAIGPPRRSSERAEDPKDVEYFWQRAQKTRKLVYKKEFPTWYTKEIWLKQNASDMARYIPYFSESTHKPLFLIDGELENDPDKIYLREYYELLSEPKKYMTIENSDHYFNSMGVLGFNIYDRKVMSRAIGEIDKWLRM